MASLTTNKYVNSWIDEMAAMTQPDSIVWIDGSDEQTEALYLTACSYYSMFDLESCLKCLTQIWEINGKQFEEEYLDDKRFKHMFANIALLNKRNRQKD